MQELDRRVRDARLVQPELAQRAAERGEAGGEGLRGEVDVVQLEEPQRWRGALEKLREGGPYRLLALADVFE